ncbi:DEAD/DEAH box helicase [Sorangium sp. So ce119]|uniref:AAA domain-containing protein n=1 Tax=Sorangium sp. So ce119 TaxID=3133279 RepID=UPI003F6488DD
MAELFFQNLVNHRPEVAQKATYENLQAFYRYLERAKHHLDRTRFELGWRLLGAVVRLDPPRGARDAASWRAQLQQLLGQRRLLLRPARGPARAPIDVHAKGGFVVLDAAPQPGAEVEVSAEGTGRALRALPVLLSDDEHIRQALADAGPVWIELVEPADERSTAALEAFLDEDTDKIYEVVPGEREREAYAVARRIDVRERDPERLALRLTRLPRTPVLCMRPNTYVVECEMRAIQALQDQPLAGHRPLIRLFENREKVEWQRPSSPDGSPGWQVLTRDERPGTREQREFVERALRTPDFMLLEGPPGSGKTTAIVELILQLAARGRRVLLCASTHVAVDNVLERLKDAKRPGGPVLAVRIGPEKRVGEKIKDYCLNRMVAKELENVRAALEETSERSAGQAHMLEALRAEDGSETLKRILLDCAEVVCGTTIGILKHPDIEGRVRGCGVWEPVFDALILDEASKTPFSEFLVPALLARRWIIVGDRRQLSPYVEEGWIETNVDAALPAASREEAGRALLDAFRLTRSDEGALLVASDSEEVRSMYAERIEELFPGEPVVRLDVGEPPGPLLLAAARAVVGTPAQLAAVQEILPLPTCAVRLPAGDELQATRRRHEARAQRRQDDEDSWAKSVTWRLVRDYELRLLPELLGGEEGTSVAQKYAREIDLLLPREDGSPLFARVRESIERVRRVALPSILESLQVGFDPARSARGRGFWSNTLALGLTQAEKEERLVSLRYQHRMHPDIASFPHKHIYSGELLETPDGMAEERSFPYPRYRSRVVLLDVRGQERSRPSIANEAEADVVIGELRALATWAAGVPRKEPWYVAVLTFYRGQERLIRDRLRAETGQDGQQRHFTFHDGDRRLLDVDLCTVDRYQGHEADIVLLSLVRTRSPGFLNSPNRLNVAITRARYQLVLIGHGQFLAKQKERAPMCSRLAWDLKLRGCVERRY